MYGQDATARYPGQQEEFFEKAAQGLGRREAMYSFLALAGPAACLIFGAKGAKDANLPITVGPQKEPSRAPRPPLNAPRRSHSRARGARGLRERRTKAG